MPHKNHELFENDREWRRFLIKEMRDLRSELDEVKTEVHKSNKMLEGLRIKVTGVASIVSGIVAIGAKKLGL